MQKNCIFSEPSFLVNYKRLHIFNGFIFLVLLSINLVIYKNRDNGYAYKEYLSYNRLYQPSDVLSLAGTQFNGDDSLTLTFSVNQLSDSWEIKLPDSIHYICKNKPVIKLQEGINDYTLKNLNKKDSAIQIRLNYVTTQSYKKSGRNRSSDVELMQISIPIKEPKTFPLAHWIQSSQFTTESEIALAKKILTDSMQIIATESSTSKIEKISTYILRKIGSEIGMPSDNMDAISPLQQCILAQQHKSKVWCGNFASIFSFFANTAGIATRSVWIEGNANGILTAGHLFNECYIPELDQWIFVDLTSNTLSIQTDKNKYLNSVEFYRAQQLHSTHLIATTYQNDSIKKLPFNDSASFYTNYFNANIQFVYYYASQYDNSLYNPTEKIKRYLFKHPTFANYSDASKVSNVKFYKKQMAFFALIFFALYWIISSIILKFNHRR